MAAGPSLETELHQTYQGQNVAMLGLDVYNGSLTQLIGFGQTARVSFPLLQQAGNNTHSFSREDLIVVGQDGIVRFYGRVANAQARQQAREVIDALLVKSPLVEPLSGSLFFDRKVAYGETRSTELRIKNIGNGPLTVTEIQANQGTFSSPDLPITIAPGESQKITIVFTADTTQDVQASLSILSNANTVSIPITPIEILSPPPPKLNLVQTTIHFGDFDQTRSAQQQLTLQNSGEGPLTISNIQGDLTNLTISPSNLTLAPGESANITVFVNADQTGTLSGNVQITSDDPNTPVFNVPVTGEAITIPAEPLADVNGNGTVDFPDFLSFAQAFGQFHPTLDFNNNGTVDFPDFLTFAKSFGKTIN